MKKIIPFVFILLLFGAGASWAADGCLGCHEKETPGIVGYWKESAHYKKQIGCTDCHGDDKEASHKGLRRVEASKCGECHERSYKDHRLSRHGVGLRTGRGCTRNISEDAGKNVSCVFCHEPGSAKPVSSTECAMFLAQSPEMKRRGCDSCHMVEVRCDSCHTKHGTDISLAGSPEVCGVCHMGPDHAQYEMWESSQHGVIHKQKGRGAGPSCATCHMDGGSHNVSRGIATGIPEGEDGMRARERDFMVAVCSRCHTPSLSKSNLSDADEVERQSAGLVEEAKRIIDGLHKDGLLIPSPGERPPHPLAGHEFVIGPNMLYENLSSVESMFFRMKQFYYMSAFKGAFHQNPDYAHWYGNAPLKLSLSEIKSEAGLLRLIDNLKKRVDVLSAQAGQEEGPAARLNPAVRLKKKLMELEGKRLSGVITEDEYKRLKAAALDEEGF